MLAAVALAVAPDAILADVPLPAELPLIGLFFVAGMFLLGLFHLPGQAATYLGRLRRALDGVGVGIWAFFIAWLLIIGSAGLKGAALTAILVASVAVSASVVGALRAAPVHRPALLYGAVSGVRSEPELRASVNAGCRLGQGDLFCTPAVPERVEAYLDTHRSATF